MIIDVREIREKLKNNNEVIVNQDGSIVPVNQDNEDDEQTQDNPKTLLKPNRWYAWYDDQPTRLIAEDDTVRSRFPQFRLKKMGDKLAWVGTLVTNRGRDYEVAVVYPDSFPAEPPEAYILHPKIKPRKAKHMYANGKLCLFHPRDHSYSGNTTAATVIAWTAAWLFSYEDWRETGVWPGKEAD